MSIGEGDYATTEKLIRQLLTAAHPTGTLPASTQVRDTTPDNTEQTPETYFDSQSLTAGAGAGIALLYDAKDIYLDVGGTGTITATVDGASKTYPVCGAPNIYTVLGRDDAESGTLTVTLTPGLTAYSFTFG